MIGSVKRYYHLPCYFYDANSVHRGDGYAAQYRRLNMSALDGFQNLHCVDKDLVRRLDYRQLHSSQCTNSFHIPLPLCHLSSSSPMPQSQHCLHSASLYSHSRVSLFCLIANLSCQVAGSSAVASRCWTRTAGERMSVSGILRSTARATIATTRRGSCGLTSRRSRGMSRARNAEQLNSDSERNAARRRRQSTGTKVMMRRVQQPTLMHTSRHAAAGSEQSEEAKTRERNRSSFRASHRRLRHRSEIDRTARTRRRRARERSRERPTLSVRRKTKVRGSEGDGPYVCKRALSWFC